MNSNRLIEELLGEQTRVIDELDRLNARIEEVLKTLTIAARDEQPAEDTSCQLILEPSSSITPRRRAA